MDGFAPSLISSVIDVSVPCIFEKKRCKVEGYGDPDRQLPRTLLSILSKGPRLLVGMEWTHLYSVLSTYWSKSTKAVILGPSSNKGM